jgi:transposase
MIPTPAQPHRRYGIGAVNYHIGETVVQFERRKRRKAIAALLEALVAKPPDRHRRRRLGQRRTHEDDEVEEMVRAAAGCLVLLDLPTYSPWLNPIEMLRRHFRREVTHCERFTTMAELLAAANDFFDRHKRQPQTILSVIGSKATNPI